MITPEEMAGWAAYIKSICGIDLDPSKNYLVETRLAPLMRESDSASWKELLAKVKFDTSMKLRRSVIDLITTGETSFFRDTAPFDLLQFKVIPDLIDKRKKQCGPASTIPIRIWSAACSSGQEVYSIAIVLREMLGNLNGYDIRILGTDISDRAIAAASYGKYSRLEIERGMRPGMLEKYFNRDNDSWKIRDEVRAMSSYRTLNLLEPFFFPFRFDIVLCRNVAIYFSEADKKGLFRRIGDVLAPDGYLIIGATESITTLCPSFIPQRYQRSVFYEKKAT